MQQPVDSSFIICVAFVLDNASLHRIRLQSHSIYIAQGSLSEATAAGCLACTQG
jgi:hypothetical protein